MWDLGSSRPSEVPPVELRYWKLVIVTNRPHIDMKG
jgi:hypothetical protein